MGVDKQIADRVTSRRENIRIMESENRAKLVFNDYGKYVEKKLEFIRKYLYIYSKIVGAHFSEMWYIEPESGPGCCQIKTSGRILLGSPLLALSNEPYFHHYRFIEKDINCAKALDQRIKSYFPDKDALIKFGDCNIVLKEVLDEFSDNVHFLSIIDPKGLEFKMSTMILFAQKANAELYINYPYDMAIKRCISPNAYEATQKTVTEYFGGNEWISIRDDHYNKKISADEARKKLLDLYMSKIRDIGFEFASYSDIIFSDSNRPLYYLIHASKTEVAKRTMKQVMKVGKDYQQIQKKLFEL